MILHKRAELNIEFSTEALKANLLRLENEWSDYQSSRNRDGIYPYLTAVFALVLWWKHERKDGEYARRALWLKGHWSVATAPEPFASVILCTADRMIVDDKARSKWSRVLRYAAEYKDLDEPLQCFIKRKGGINRCAARYARRLGRTAMHIPKAEIKSRRLFVTGKRRLRNT
jgi:hypothetical protein